MKIVLTVHQFLPDYSSGTEILTFEVAKKLIQMGHIVTVVTGFPAKEDLKDTERFDMYTIDGIDVVRFRHNYEPTAFQSNPLEIEYNNRLFKLFFRKYLHKEKPDIVHFFHLMRLSSSAVDACYELDIPTVFTPTDFWFICPTAQLMLPNGSKCQGPDVSGVNCLRHVVDINQPEKTKRFLRMMPDWLVALIVFMIRRGVKFDHTYSQLIKAFSNRRKFLVRRLNNIDRILVPTEIMLSSLSQNGLDKDLVISIPFGLNLEYVKNAIRPRLSKVLHVGYIGTLSKHKGVHTLIQAIRTLDINDVELHIYGSLDDFPDYVAELFEQSANDSRIKFLKTFPNYKIGEVFSTLDVLVVPSLWHENSPLIVYTAQAARCPVIGSKMDGISEIIKHGENGLLFEAGNVDELALAIKQLFDDRELLNKLSKNAKKPQSIHEYTEKIVEIYTGLLAQRKN